jgi:sugar lactone lactonase YvrE
MFARRARFQRGNARRRREQLPAGGGGAGVHCYSPDGDLLGQIHLPETCANFCFGGVKKNRLFITASR